MCFLTRTSHYDKFNHVPLFVIDWQMVGIKLSVTSERVISQRLFGSQKNSLGNINSCECCYVNDTVDSEGQFIDFHP